MRTVTGDVFIVPHKAMVYGHWVSAIWFEDIVKLFKCKPGTVMIEVMTTSAEHENWIWRNGPFTADYLPFDLLDGKKEGDQIRVFVPANSRYNKSPESLKVVFTARQSGYRYRRYGKFEEVLKLVTSKRTHLVGEPCVGIFQRLLIELWGIHFKFKRVS